MPRTAEPSLNEKGFILQALRQNLRLDNREFDAYRKLELTLGDEYGVADVRLGKTRSVQESVFWNSELTSKQSHCSHIVRCERAVSGAQIRRHLYYQHRILTDGVSGI